MKTKIENTQSLVFIVVVFANWDNILAPMNNIKTTTNAKFSVAKCDIFKLKSVFILSTFWNVPKNHHIKTMAAMQFLACQKGYTQALDCWLYRHFQTIYR